jgi:hypothetical protein
VVPVSNKNRPTKKDMAAAAQFLGWLQGEIGLERYKLHLKIHRGDSVGAAGMAEGHEVMAAVDPWFGKNEADVFVGRHWRSYDDEMQAEALTHELVHLHVRGLAEVVRVGTLELDEQAYSTLQHWARVENEMLTDTITRLLLKAMPIAEVWNRLKQEHGA